MGRDKLKRNLQFKPQYISFEASESDNKESIHLLHEEMEALYLMDAKELYQADAASQMGVSRATFARILKNARQKVTMMLITGAKLHIDDEKSSVLIMVPSEEKDAIVKSTPKAKYLLIFHVENKEIIKRGHLANPVYEMTTRPAQVLPLLCSTHKINFFITETLGLGLKSALLSKGVYSSTKENLEEEDILKLY